MIKYLSNIIVIIVLTVIIVIIPIQYKNTIYATNEADIELYIYGEHSKGGPMFQQSGNIGSGGPWVPGMRDTGTLRINNNYSKAVKISSLGLKMKLEKKLNDDEYEIVKDRNLYELYAKNMKLSIKKGTLPVFSNTIYDKSFYEMLYGKVKFVEENKEIEVDYQGFNLGILDKVKISKDQYIDLEYTVHMDKKAGNEMQGLRTTVDFLINVHENTETNNDSDKVKKDSITTDKHWAHNCIKELLDNGIIQGYPNGKMNIEGYKNGEVKLAVYIEEAVKPEENITRAETAELIDNALDKLLDNYGEIRENDLSKFYDDHNKISYWAKPHVMRLTEKDIMEGYPGIINKKKNYFKPNKEISREEMTAVLIRAFETKLENEIELEFIDKDKIAKWAEEYVKAAVENKVIEGYPDKTFKPKNSITRAEAFTIICKLLGYHDTH